MTREEIDALDLDALNVECAKAMGWHENRDSVYLWRNDELGIFQCDPPNYSRDMGSAWVLWRELFDKGKAPVIMTNEMSLVLMQYFGYSASSRNPDDIPAMICRAFLAAKGGEK